MTHVACTGLGRLYQMRNSSIQSQLQPYLHKGNLLSYVVLLSTVLCYTVTGLTIAIGSTRLLTTRASFVSHSALGSARVTTTMATMTTSTTSLT